MKTFIDIIFVYIPYGFCVLFQLIFLVTLASDTEGVATLAKWIFPIVAVAAIVLHFLNRKKNAA